MTSGFAIMRLMKFTGLTTEEVRARVNSGQINNLPDKSSRKVGDIFAENIFTLFNLIQLMLAAAVIAVGGGWINLTFFLIVIINSAIGIIQELAAKKTLDRISILVSPRVKVIRDGKIQQILIHQVVLGDYVRLGLGDQVVADGEIVSSDELEIDESLLTGESDPIVKKNREKVLSGSIVVAGSGIMRTTAVGMDSYAAKLVTETKRFDRKNYSEIQTSINKILKWILWALIVIVPFLVIGQLRIHADWHMSVLRSIAAINGMIPNGIIMLVSITFVLAALNLTRKKVLVQRMPAVETLARVDTLLLDKTGTLTEGDIRFEASIIDDDSRRVEVATVLRTIASRNAAPTNNAIAERLAHVKIAPFTREIQFSSSRKFSAISIAGHNYVFGAPEILFADKKFAKNLSLAQDYARRGKRVLALCENPVVFSANSVELTKIFVKNQPLALVILSEKIRPSAAKTLKYFREQGVDIKVISGDSPVTVAAIAQEVGLRDVCEFDARKLPKPDTPVGLEKFTQIVLSHNVFGRVQPEQKRQIAEALQKRDRVVAMTGDGVNDALALKKADIGIAMESGSAATKSVAEIVLLDNDFAHLPDVLAEGRRVIGNIERVASLFIVKNMFVLMTAILTTVVGMTYPYLPIQMTVIDALTIGLPGFFLALAPNSQKYHRGFLKRVLCFAIPVGMIVALVMFVDYFLTNRHGVTPIIVSGTSVAITTVMMLLTALATLSRPFNWWKATLVSATGGIFVGILLSPLHKILKFQISKSLVPVTLLVGLIGVILVVLVSFISRQFAKNKV